MRAVLIALSLLSLEMLIIGSATASIIQVPSAHSTIQAGINAAVSGDTVQVAPGTYTGPSNRNLDFGGKNILLRSSTGAATTIIDCQSLARGIRFHTGEAAAAIVQGFTIRNGLASGDFGGAILIEGGANPTIRNCRLQSNHANTGGAISVVSGVTLIGCEFTDNAADNGGGAIYGDDAILQSSECTFTQNHAALGAGIYVDPGTTLTLSDCTFTENMPANLAGGVYASGSTVTIRRSSFIRNTGKHGAGVYALSSVGEIDSCTFSANSAVIRGGGLFWEGGASLTLADCEFAGNLATTGAGNFASGGAGAYILGMEAIEILSCDFSDNAGQQNAGAGGGLFLRNSTSATLTGSSFINNSATLGGGLWISNVDLSMSDGVFERNMANNGDGGAMYSILCRIVIAGSAFAGNQAGDNGGAIAANTTSPIEIEDSEFSGNSATLRGGAVAASDTCAITDCTFTGNSAAEGGSVAHWHNLGIHKPFNLSGCTLAESSAAIGGGVFTRDSDVEVVGCTLVRNTGSFGGGFAFTGTSSAVVSNVIVALSPSGQAVYCEDAGNPPALSCTDLFANVGGDWVGCISDQVGINGNFALNPLFCNAGGGDYTLAQASPCSPAHSPAGCGLIGANPVACATPIGIADAGAPAVAPILRLTPNPIQRTGMIEWSGVGERETELRLYDVAGRIVARHVDSGTKGELPWSTLVGASDVPSGVYFLGIGARRQVSRRVRLVVVR